MNVFTLVSAGTRNTEYAGVQPYLNIEGPYTPEHTHLVLSGMHWIKSEEYFSFLSTAKPGDILNIKGELILLICKEEDYV